MNALARIARRRDEAGRASMWGPRQQPDHVVTTGRGRRVRRDGRWLLDFASCDYLGLARDPRLAEAVRQDASRGASLGLPRAIGVDPLIPLLEAEIARLVVQEMALVFPSTVHAASDVLRLLAGPGGLFLIDERAYPISWAAARVAGRGTRLASFPHNDDRALGRLMVRFAATPDKVVVCDGVYVGGEVARLDRFVALASRYDAVVYADDAHGVGVLGARRGGDQPLGVGGAGAPAYAGVPPGNLVHVGGLSKAFGVPIAFVAGPAPFIRLLRASAASYVHSSQPATPLLAAALAALCIHAREGHARRRNLVVLIDRFRAGVASLDSARPGPGRLPIQSLIFPSPELAGTLAASLRRRGIWALPQPAPGKGGAVRFVFSAAHQPADIDEALEAIAATLRRTDVTPFLARVS